MKLFLKCIPVYLLMLPSFVFSQKGYNNFRVTVYAQSYEVRQMADKSWIEPIWDEISRQVHVDKIYLETHRDLVLVGEDTLRITKEFFIHIYSPGKVSLFAYDNRSFIVESFLDNTTEIEFFTAPELQLVTDLVSGDQIAGELQKPPLLSGRAVGEEKNKFTITRNPHSNLVYKVD